MKTLSTFLLLFASLFAVEQGPVPNEPLQNQGIHTSLFFPKVNPITGEYIEEECDLVVAGCEPLAARRFYNHMAYPNSLYGLWRLNPETLIKANFDYPHLEQSVMVGEREGGCTLLDTRKVCTYSFNPTTQPSFTNTSSGILSAQTNPKNITIDYWKNIGEKDEFQVLGQLTDGTGRKVTFATHVHRWHNSMKNPDKKSRQKNIYPKSWIPYYCKLLKETLPNGNYLEYSYTRWIDDKHFPTHYRISTITAYNKNHQKLNHLYFTYNNQANNNTTDITITGSDNRTTHYNLNYIAHATYQLHAPTGKVTTFQEDSCPAITQTTHPHKPQITYAYDDNLRIYQTTYPNGRYFLTGYGPDGKVAEQYAPLGPNGEQITLATFTYNPTSTTIQDALGHHTTYHHDTNKRITAIERQDSIERNTWDPQGQLTTKTLEDKTGTVLKKTTFHYDNKGNVTQEILEGNLTGTGTSTHTITRTYTTDTFNQIESETDNLGKTTTYTYKPGTNLPQTQHTYDHDKLIKRIHYTYDDNAICIKKVTDDGLNPTYIRTTHTKPKTTHPCFGLPQEILETTQDPQGNEILLNKTTYTYHPSGQINQETHFDANEDLCYTITNQYDNSEKLTQTTDPLGNITTYTYDPNHNLLTKTGPLTTTHYTYNHANLPIQEATNNLTTTKTYNPLGQLTTQTDPAGNTTTYIHDHLGRITQIHHPDGGITQKEYDPLGNLTKQTDPLGNTTHTTYTIRGQPIHITHPDGTTEHHHYNPNGTLATYTDKNGTQTHYTYDILDRILEEKTYAPDNTHLKTTTNTYSTFTHLTHTDPLGTTTTYTYDKAGRKIAEQTANRHIHYTYDPLGRLTHTQTHDTLTIQTYDHLNHLLEKKIQDLQGTTYYKITYTYDANGNRTQTITDTGITQTTYNPHNQPIQIIDPQGNTTHIHYTYDPTYTKTTKDPKHIQHITTHDPCNRPKEHITLNPSGQTIHHQTNTYDLAGNKTTQTDHIYQNTTPTSTQTTTYTYGPNNRLEKRLESDLKQTTYTYNPHGQLATLTKPDNTQIHYVYDHLGRLQTLTVPDISYTYTYDKNNRPIQINNTKRTYDPLGNITQEQLENGITIHKTYDPQGRPTQFTLPTTTATYTYKGGYLYQVTTRDHTHTYTTRNLTGKPLTTTLPSNLGTIHHTYDSSNRLTSTITPYYTAHDYQYDPTNNLTHYTYTDQLGTQTNTYTYDDLNQLTSENAHIYTYDSLNNRLTKNQKRHTHNTLSQLTNDGDQTYTYDPNGNLIQAGETHLTYDSLDRLISVTIPQGQTTYTYDPFNRRLTKTTPKTQTNYIWDGQNELGTANEHRILGEGLGAEIGAAVFININNKIYIPIHNHQGSVVALVDLSKQTEPYRYTAFGEELTNNTLSPWRFASKRHDEETGYLYFGRRYYSPQLGRWITPDPKGFKDGPNLYAYVHNNPLTAYDLYGLKGEYANNFQAFWYRMKGADYAFRDIALNMASRMGGMTFNRNLSDLSSPMMGNWEHLSIKNPSDYPKMAFRTALPYTYDLHHLPDNISPHQKWIAEGKAGFEQATWLIGGAKSLRSMNFGQHALPSVNPMINLTTTEFCFSGIPLESGNPKTANMRTKYVKPHPEAEGVHSTFKRDPISNIVTGYETYGFSEITSEYQAVKRFRGVGGPHGKYNPPFILEPKSGKGIGAPVKVPRVPEEWELPYGY